MKKLITLAVIVLIFGCKQKEKKEQQAPEQEINMKTESDDWVNLFDGSSFDGWHEYLGKGFLMLGS